MKQDKALMALPRKTSLAVGDAYVDEPVFKDVPVYCAKEPVTQRQITHFRRVPLLWRKPDGKGGLRPMNNCSDSEERA